MDSYIIRETAKTVLNLLQRVDDGYVLTEDELRSLEKISVVDFSDLGLEKCTVDTFSKNISLLYC